MDINNWAGRNMKISASYWMFEGGLEARKPVAEAMREAKEHVAGRLFPSGKGRSGISYAV